MFNHPSPKVTLSYLSITVEEFTSLMLNHSSPKQALSHIGIPNASSLARQAVGSTEEKTELIRTNFRNRMNHIYQEYNQSRIWLNVVKAVIERDKKTCQDCGTQPKIGIAHHTSYQNWAKGNNEEIRDCVFLCKKCHNARHRNNRDEPTPFWASRNYDPDLDKIDEGDVVKLLMQEI
ncbi:MAG: HNH endonuclease [Nitrospira sp.]|nr:HNH endonuclease [Nitrospira sp.]